MWYTASTGRKHSQTDNRYGRWGLSGARKGAIQDSATQLALALNTGAIVTVHLASDTAAGTQTGSSWCAAQFGTTKEQLCLSTTAQLTEAGIGRTVATAESTAKSELVFVYSIATTHDAQVR